MNYSDFFTKGDYSHMKIMLLLEKVPQDLFHSVYFEYEENFTHDRLLSLSYVFCHIKRLIKIRAVAGQRSSPDLCFVTESITSMTKDIDLSVTRVGRDGTA